MKSRTSSSDLTIFRKDITRFAPIWLAWTAVLLFVWYLMYDMDADPTGNYAYFHSCFGNWASAVYGFVVAVNLFGYLSDPRECGMVHSLPIRREKLFLLHFLAGLVMELIPVTLFVAGLIPLAWQNSLLGLYGSMLLQFWFYFALAVFCVFLTGRKFAAAVVYGLLNFLGFFAYLGLDILYLPLLPGVHIDTSVFLEFCPPVSMLFRVSDMDVWEYLEWTEYIRYLGVFALVGLGLVAASVVLYRRRRLEYAGDFIAVKWLQPVFIAAVSVACGCVGAVMGDTFFDVNYIVLLILFLVIGYFAVLMLINRTARVFSLKKLAGLGCVLALMLGSLWITAQDPLGVVGYVPKPEQVERVEFYEYDFEGDCYYTEDPEKIAELIALHEDILDCGPYTDSAYLERAYFLYHLTDGTTVRRGYYVMNLELAQRSAFYHSQPESMLGVATLDELLDRLVSVDIERSGSTEEYSYFSLSKADAQELMTLMFDECRAGVMVSASQEWDNTYCYLYITLDDPDARNGSGYDTNSYYFFNIPTTAEQTYGWIMNYQE